jgi:hypothetical protein
MGGTRAVTGVVMVRGNGSIWGDGSYLGASWYFSERSQGDVIGMAVDLDNRKMWFRIAPTGNWNTTATANPATNTEGIPIPAGTMVPWATFGGGAGLAGNVTTANFGASTFTGTVPSGFTSGWLENPPVTYVTWDAATVATVTLSGSDLVATNTGTTATNQGARVAAASGKTSGKYYFEVTLTTKVGGGGGNAGMGIATTASTYAGMGNNATAGVEVFISSGGMFVNGANPGQVLGGAFVNGEVAGIAVDLDNRKAWIRKAPSGNWNASGTANPATNVGGNTIPAGTIAPINTFGGGSGTSGNVFTANFGASAFTGAVPSGFTSGWPA